MDEGGKRDDEEEKSLMRWKETGYKDKEKESRSGKWGFDTRAR